MSGLRRGAQAQNAGRPCGGLSPNGWGSPALPRLGERGCTPEQGRPTGGGGLGREPEARSRWASSPGQRDLGEASQLDSLAGHGENLAF